MATSSKTDAEVRYARAQKRVHEAATAHSEVEAEARRVTEKTARLKALRLAREAADAEAKAAMPAKKPVAKKAKVVAAKPRMAGTRPKAKVPADKLTAANDD